jgi:hypothetical protein
MRTRATWLFVLSLVWLAVVVGAILWVIFAP